MKKIIILGSPGSGKSTFARKLQEKTGLPLVHLDQIWWKPDRTHISREQFDQLLEGIVSGERWIIDGNYSRTYEVRMAACDTVIFLDYDRALCMEGITKRIGQGRPDIPWTEQTLDSELAALVERFDTENRPVIYGLLEKYPDRQAFIFHDREEADGWLKNLK